MMKKLLIFSLFAFAGSGSTLVSFEPPQGKKRAAQETIEQEPKAQRGESESESSLAESAPVQQEIYTLSTLPGVPEDIQIAVIEYLVSAPGKTEDERFNNAVENIRNFLMINRRYKQLLDDPQLAGLMSKQLAKIYTNDDVVKAALALNTNAASIWLANHTKEQLGINPDGSLKLPVSDEAKLLAMQLQGALDFAVNNDRIDILRFLLTYQPALANWQVNIRVDNMVDFLPLLDVAVSTENIPLIRLLLKLDAKITDAIVTRAAANVTPAALDELAKAGVDLRKLFEDESLLSFATSGQVIDYLIAHGLDVNKQNKQGNTPLALAILAYDPQLMDLFLKRNAHLPEKVYEKQSSETFIALSPLAFLLRVPLYQNPQVLFQMLNLLIEHGANVNEVITDPNTGAKVTLLTYIKNQRTNPVMRIIVGTLIASGAYE